MSRKRFLFVFGEGGGNVPPQLGLARRLLERGHEVHVLTEPSVEDEVLATGASFASFTTAPHRHDRSPDTDLVRDFEAFSPLGRLAAYRDRVIFGPASSYAADAKAEIERWRPDVLAADWVRTGIAVAGEATGVPTALLVHGLSLLPEPGKPPPGFGFAPARSPLGRRRDARFERGFAYLFNKGLPALNAARRSCGLQPLGHVLDHFSRQDRLLCLYSEAFDFPATRQPNVRFVGPILEEPGWVDPWDPPWPASDTRPLVVTSMSTAFMDQASALQRWIEALSRMSSIRALVTVGPALDPAAFERADNVAVLRSAPHGQVFADAAAIVTHGGMGSVSRALAHGVPMVCMPLGRDQHDIAARVEWHGAGLQIGRRSSVAKMRSSLEEVLGDGSFKAAAMRHRAAIEADLAADRAVFELEGLAR